MNKKGGYSTVAILLALLVFFILIFLAVKNLVGF